MEGAQRRQRRAHGPAVDVASLPRVAPSQSPEVTGTLGILGKVSQSVDSDWGVSSYGPAHMSKHAFDGIVWRHKARIAASVTRGVVRELNRYSTVLTVPSGCSMSMHGKHRV